MNPAIPAEVAALPHRVKILWDILKRHPRAVPIKRVDLIKVFNELVDEKERLADYRALRRLREASVNEHRIPIGYEVDAEEDGGAGIYIVETQSDLVAATAEIDKKIAGLYRNKHHLGIAFIEYSGNQSKLV